MSLQLYKNLKRDIDTQKYLFISASYGSNNTSTQLHYVNSGFEVYVVLHQNSQLAQLVEYNPEVKVVIDSASTAKTKGIEYKGIIEKIDDKDQNYDYAKKFTRRFNRFKSYFFSRKTFVYRIKPIQIKRIEFEQQFDDNVLEFKENDRSVWQKMAFKGKTLVRAWKEATRLQYLSTPLASVLLGTIMAWTINDSFNLGKLLLTLLGITLIYLGSNLLNEFFDHIAGKDKTSLFLNSFTGGNKVIQKGVFSAEKVLLSSIIFILSGSAIGLSLAYMIESYWLILIGFVGILLAVGFSSPVLKYSKIGLGEIAIGFAFGTVITFGSYFVQSDGVFSYLPIIASVPLSLFVMLVLFINEFQDYRADKNCGKKTIVVSIGDKFKAMKIFSILLFIPYLWIIPFAIFGLMPWWSFLIFLTIPMAIIAVKQGSTKYRKIFELSIVNKLTIGIHFLTSVLLSLAYVLDKII